MELTEGTLLGGRVRYWQPRCGFRSGLEPVLAAAAIPARPGELVIEGGCGAGAGILCLTARLTEIRCLGVEQDPATAEVARRNVEANGFAGVEIRTDDVTRMDLPPADHVFANPPYYCGGGTPPEDPLRFAAKHGPAGSITAWVTALSAPLRRRGTLTLILTAAAAPEVITALTAARCPASVIYPLWPKRGRVAKLILLRGVRNGKSAMRVFPGLTLHEEDGQFTPDAEAVLRDCYTLPGLANCGTSPC